MSSRSVSIFLLPEIVWKVLRKILLLFLKISLTYYKSSIVKRNASDKDHIYRVRFLIDVYFNYSLSQATRF